MADDPNFRPADAGYRVTVVDCGFGMVRIVSGNGSAVMQVMTPANMQHEFFIPAQSAELLLDVEAIRQIITGLSNAIAD